VKLRRLMADHGRVNNWGVVVLPCFVPTWLLIAVHQKQARSGKKHRPQ
jgi:hypothetical protein